MSLALGKTDLKAKPPALSKKSPLGKPYALEESLEIVLQGQAWWLMSIILALWEAKAGRSTEVRSLRPAWPTW